MSPRNEDWPGRILTLATSSVRREERETDVRAPERFLQLVQHPAERLAHALARTGLQHEIVFADDRLPAEILEALDDVRGLCPLAAELQLQIGLHTGTGGELERGAL